MVNTDFQELNRLYSVHKVQLEQIIQKMKDNLTIRNGGKDEYTFGYTEPGRVEFISQCEYESLLAIDGDMCPMGL